MRPGCIYIVIPALLPHLLYSEHLPERSPDTHKMVLPVAILASMLAAAPVVMAATTSCSASSQCPEDLPCCNQFGECGTGAHCLGGCSPLFSYNKDACMAMPVCKDIKTTFGTQAYPNVDEYLGNPDDTDWIFAGYAQNNADGDALLITMPNGTSGTVLSSARYVLYGKYGAHMKTSRTAGVVSALISFSDSQDEIDWEFVGYELEVAETNFYHQGVLDWNNVIYENTTDTYANYHYYEVDWQEDEITWYLDGDSVRTLKKSDTYNSTSGEYAYPQTPARVQFSIWPVLSTAGEGTIEWAGGSIDWDSDDIEDDGYFAVTIKDAYITCADLPSNIAVEGSKAYVYNSSTVFNQDTVMLTDDNTILCSSDNTGLDDNDACAAGSSSVSSSESSSESSSSSSSVEPSSSANSSSTSSKSKSTSEASSSSTESASSSDSTSSESTSSSGSATSSGFVQDASSTATSTSSTSSASTLSNGAMQVIGSGSVGVITALVMLFM